jgi:hypothetical protein
MEITLKLTVEEVNGILQTLGQLPTSSGAWPLVVKIKEQAESQVPQDQAPVNSGSNHPLSCRFCDMERHKESLRVCSGGRGCLVTVK